MVLSRRLGTGNWAGVQSSIFTLRVWQRMNIAA
jgi:hypothetical protein